MIVTTSALSVPTARSLGGLRWVIYAEGS